MTSALAHPCLNKEPAFHAVLAAAQNFFLVTLTLTPKLHGPIIQARTLTGRSSGLLTGAGKVDIINALSLSPGVEEPLVVLIRLGDLYIALLNYG